MTSGGLGKEKKRSFNGLKHECSDDRGSISNVYIFNVIGLVVLFF